MATFIKRGNKYQVQVRRRGFPTVCRSFHRRTDADEWARSMEVQADRGDMPAPLRTLAQYTVKDLLERYQREVSIKKRGYNTERYVLERMARQPFAALSLAALTSAKLAEYRDQRLKTVQPGTIRRDLSILKIVLDTASREWGLPLRENPVTRLPRIKPQSGRTRRLGTDELKQLEIEALRSRNPYVLPVMRFAIATGMRRGEILGMVWGHINRDNRTLLIPFTKNGYARTIPLSSEALSVLDHMEKHGRTDNRASVFLITGNGFQQAWERLCRKAGITDLHFHDLRHEAISRFVERGLSIPEVALISGHRDYRMLARYTHLKPENLVEKLG